MRDYARVSPQFWIGMTGKALRGDSNAQIVALYLMTSPHATMIGVFHCPVIYVVHETGLSVEGASEGLQRVVEEGFCTFDHDRELVWVHEMARFQIGAELKPNDKQVMAIGRAFQQIPECQIRRGFHARYQRAFHLPGIEALAAQYQGAPKGDQRGIEGPPMLLRSQEQEQEQEQDLLRPVLPEPAKRVSNTYSPEFEAAWSSYPRRAGGNPKPRALRAWNARVAEGIAPKVMHDGVLRYAAYLRATGKEATEFVQQAATFFGPDRPFMEPWAVPINGKAVVAAQPRGLQVDGSYVGADGRRWDSAEAYLREQAGAAYHPEMLERLLASDNGGEKCARAA